MNIFLLFKISIFQSVLVVSFLVVFIDQKLLRNFKILGIREISLKH